MIAHGQLICPIGIAKVGWYRPPNKDEEDEIAKGKEKRKKKGITEGKEGPNDGYDFDNVADIW